jgi:hypothetical protein
LKFPDFSVRLDPFNWLLEGRLGLEIEVEMLEWLTLETVPIFVVDEEPVIFADSVHQNSNGLGALAGASIGAGFWLDGDSFNGTVLRVGLTNYGYEYFSLVEQTARGHNKGDRLDGFNQTERRFSFVLGSGRTWKAFTLAGGIGLEYELNKQFRCVSSIGNGTLSVSKSVCDDEDQQQLLLSQVSGERANVNGILHPFDLAARISLGVVIDD